MKNKTLYILLISVPCFLLGLSFLNAPYIFYMAISDNTLGELTGTPSLLYRKGTTSFYYTSMDLLHPEELGDPGQYIQGIVFDLLPQGESDTNSLKYLTWVRQIAWALSLKDADGDELPGYFNTAPDRALADSFRYRFVQNLELERGRVTSFTIPEGAQFRQASGLRTIVAVAIKDPGRNRLRSDHLGEDQLFGIGLRRAFEEMNKAGVTGVGIPFMSASAGLGEGLTQMDSWLHILSVCDSITTGSDVRRVLYGGFGLIQANREITDRKFRDAWTSWKDILRRKGSIASHEYIRLTAIIIFFSAISSMLRKQHISIKWCVAVVMTAAGLSIAVSSLIGWLYPLWSGVVTGGVVLCIKIILSTAAGIFLTSIVRFDRKEILKSV